MNGGGRSSSSWRRFEHESGRGGSGGEWDKCPFPHRMEVEGMAVDNGERCLWDHRRSRTHETSDRNFQAPKDKSSVIKPSPFPTFLAPKRPEDLKNLLYPGRESPKWLRLNFLPDWWGWLGAEEGLEVRKNKKKGELFWARTTTSYTLNPK